MAADRVHLDASHDTAHNQVRSERDRHAYRQGCSPRRADAKQIRATARGAVAVIDRRQIAERVRDAHRNGEELADNLELIDALEVQARLERRITLLQMWLGSHRRSGQRTPGEWGLGPMAGGTNGVDASGHGAAASAASKFVETPIPDMRRSHDGQHGSFQPSRGSDYARGLRALARRARHAYHDCTSRDHRPAAPHVRTEKSSPTTPS
jgi:hypothetical protein